MADEHQQAAMKIPTGCCREVVGRKHILLGHTVAGYVALPAPLAAGHLGGEGARVRLRLGVEGSLLWVEAHVTLATKIPLTHTHTHTHAHTHLAGYG